MKYLSSTQRIAVIGGSILAVLALLFIVFWSTSPRRTVVRFARAIEQQDIEKAQSYIRADISEERRENIDLFLDDWTSADEAPIIYPVELEEAWRVRPASEGDEKEIVPTTRHLAHHYHAYVSVEFDEFEDPVVIKLRRNATNTWSLFSQAFRQWEVARITYQPLDDEDAEFDLDALLESDEFEIEAGEDGELNLDAFLEEVELE